MGCDIHAHVEVKINGKWEHYDCPGISRDYLLFNKMAGVRHDEDSEEPIAVPRGVPHDATIMTFFDSDRWGDDGHSHSWLSAEECQKIRLWHERIRKVRGPDGPLFGYLFGNYIDSHLKYSDDMKRLFEMGFQDVRLVFWFDN